MYKLAVKESLDIDRDQKIPQIQGLKIGPLRSSGTPQLPAYGRRSNTHH